MWWSSNVSDAAKHAEIALRYRPQRERRFGFASCRLRELCSFYADRYGTEFPDDDGGRDDAFVLAPPHRPSRERRHTRDHRRNAIVGAVDAAG